MAAADDVDAEVDRLVRRLRSLSARGWQSRREPVRRLLAELVELGEPGHRLPDLPEHAFADAVSVLAWEAMRNGRRDEVAAAVRRAWESTR